METLWKSPYLDKDGLKFTSEQLTWDQNKHELSSNVFSKISYS